MGLYADDGLCHNAEPGTYGHECLRPARWLGRNATGFASGYCDECKARGFEAQQVVLWHSLAPLPAGWTWEAVEAARKRRGLPAHMVPGGAPDSDAPWITIAEARAHTPPEREQQEREAAEMLAAIARTIDEALAR